METEEIRGSKIWAKIQSRAASRSGPGKPAFQRAGSRSAVQAGARTRGCGRRGRGRGSRRCGSAGQPRRCHAGEDAALGRACEPGRCWQRPCGGSGESGEGFRGKLRLQGRGPVTAWSFQGTGWGRTMCTRVLGNSEITNCTGDTCMVGVGVSASVQCLFTRCQAPAIRNRPFMLLKEGVGWGWVGCGLLSI